MMNQTDDFSKAHQNTKRKHWLALLFVLPIYIFPVVRYLSNEGSFSLRDMFIYSGIICALEIIGVLLLQHFWIRESFS